MSASLPPGWQMTNSTGSHAGPSKLPEADDDSTDGSDMQDGDIGENMLDIRPDSPGWEDVEDDSEHLNVKDFFSDQSFPSAQAMLEHCKSAYSFDFLDICKQHNLDFYSTIRLVNYIRIQAQQGNARPDLNDPGLWADEKYMQPAMPDDSLLFCLDDIVDFGDNNQVPVDYDERMAQEAAKLQHTNLETLEE